jgi:REP element-mobilizing transposase RayT
MSRPLGYFLSWGTYGTRLHGDPRGTVDRSSTDRGDPVLGICERGLWKYHTCAAAPDHVHVILTSEHEPKTIRRILKRWLGQSMSERWPLAEGATWWAECGSIKWLIDAPYFANATGYVTRQRT